MERITKEELLEMLFHDDYEHLKGKKLRMTRVRVPGKEVCLAHVISPSQSCIYENLGLHIGVHEGEDHTGESIGLIRFTPWEAVVVAADVAMKSAEYRSDLWSFLWFSYYNRGIVPGTDCCGRGCTFL